jgi:hypothetical protein
LRYIDPTGNYSRSSSLSDYGSSSWFSDVAASYGVSSMGSSFSSSSFSSINNPFSSTGFGRYANAFTGGLFTAADFLPQAGSFFANAPAISPYAATGFAALGGFLEGLARFERFSRPGIFIVDRSNTIGWMGRVFQYDRPWRAAGGISTALTVGFLGYDLGKTFTNPYLGFNQQLGRAAIQVAGAAAMWGVGYGAAVLTAPTYWGIGAAIIGTTFVDAGIIWLQEVLYQRLGLE